jgi:hypothetical protein
MGYTALAKLLAPNSWNLAGQPAVPCIYIDENALHIIR